MHTHCSQHAPPFLSFPACVPPSTPLSICLSLFRPSSRAHSRLRLADSLSLWAICGVTSPRVCLRVRVCVWVGERGGRGSVRITYSVSFSFGKRARGGRGAEQKNKEGGGNSAALIAIALPFKKKNAPVCICGRAMNWRKWERERGREGESESVQELM